MHLPSSTKRRSQQPIRLTAHCHHFLSRNWLGRHYFPLSMVSAIWDAPVSEKQYGETCPQLYHHLRHHDIIINCHLGFRKGHPLAHASWTSWTIYMSRWTRGLSVRMLFLDPWKAFDTLHPTIPITELMDRFIASVQTYLHIYTLPRWATNQVSDPLLVTCRVPQGSILEPWLFSI